MYNVNAVLLYILYIANSMPAVLKWETVERGREMPISEARKRANTKYEAKAYDKTLIRLYAGELDQVRSHAEQRGESLNGFICRAIREQMRRDNAAGEG